MKKKVVLAGHPTPANLREHSCRNKAVDMKIIDQGLAPDMEDR